MKIGEMSEELQKRNWYMFSYRIKDIIDVKKALEGQVDIDVVMQNIIEEKRIDIEKNLIITFNNREKIIKEAFYAYHEKRYILCIPVLLTQIEGICNEVLGVNFFSKEYKKNIPLTAKKVEEKIKTGEIDESMMSYVVPLYYVSDMFTKTKSMDILNRHNIIHGIAYDYGNKLYADQCIAVLGFLLNVNKILREEADEEDM